MERNNLVITHSSWSGYVTHSMDEADECKSCIKCLKEYKAALEDGTIDKIIKQHESN